MALQNLNVPNNHAIYRDGVALVVNNPPTTAVSDVIELVALFKDGHNQHLVMAQAPGSTLLTTATILESPNPLPNSVQHLHQILQTILP